MSPPSETGLCVVTSSGEAWTWIPGLPERDALRIVNATPLRSQISLLLHWLLSNRPQGHFYMDCERFCAFLHRTMGEYGYHFEARY